MPRQDLVDELHDTLKSDVDVFFRGKGELAAADLPTRPSPTPSATSSAGSSPPPSGKSSELSPFAMVAFAAMILTSVALVYFVMAPDASAKALAQGASDDDPAPESSDDGDDGSEREEERE